MKLNLLRVLFTFGVIALLVAFAYAYNSNRSNLIDVNLGLNPSVSPTPTNTEPEESPELEEVQNVSGEITLVEPSSRNGVILLKVLLGNSNVPINVEADLQTNVVDESNNKIQSSTLNKGFVISLSGTPTEGALRATEIKVIKAPNIIVFSPENNDTVGKLFEVNGTARVFENVLHIRVTNNRNKEVYVSVPVMADAKDTGQYGPYNFNVNLTAAKDLKNDDTLNLEVFQFSAKDGTEVDKISITLLYKE